MHPEAGRGAFRLALFISITAAALLVASPRGTAEFVVSALALVVGLLLLALVALVVRRTSR